MSLQVYLKSTRSDSYLMNTGTNAKLSQYDENLDNAFLWILPDDTPLLLLNDPANALKPIPIVLRSKSDLNFLSIDGSSAQADSKIKYNSHIIRLLPIGYEIHGSQTMKITLFKGGINYNACLSGNNLIWYHDRYNGDTFYFTIEYSI